MTDTREIVITADAHVGETDELRQRLPEQFRDSLPEFGVDEIGNLDFKFKGESFPKRHHRKPTGEDMLREFRTDPSQGTDLDRRLHDMAVEGGGRAGPFFRTSVWEFLWAPKRAPITKRGRGPITTTCGIPSGHSRNA